MHTVLRERRTSAQNGEVGFGFGRRFFARRSEASESSRSKKIIHTEMYSVFGARLPMQGRELSPYQLSEDEESRYAYKSMQTQDKRRLSYLQTTHSFVLLSR